MLIVDGLDGLDAYLMYDVMGQQSKDTLCHCLRFIPDVWKFGILYHFAELAYSVYAVALCIPLWIEFLLGGAYLSPYVG